MKQTYFNVQKKNKIENIFTFTHLFRHFPPDNIGIMETLYMTFLFKNETKQKQKHFCYEKIKKKKTRVKQ